MKISRNKLKEIVREAMIEESEYQEFFKKALEKAGKSIPSMSDEEKKAFFNNIEKTWKGRGAKKESVEEAQSPAQKAAFQKMLDKKKGKDDDKKEEVKETVTEGKFKKEEKSLKNLQNTLKIDFSEAMESLQDDGVLEAMDHLENAISRIKDVNKILKRKS
jgi:hypothetical protein